MSLPFTVQAHPDLILDLQDGGLRQIYFKGTPMLYSDLSIFAKKNKRFFGQFVVPVAGRIKGGTLKGFRFEKNENGNALHSSNHLLSFKEYSSCIKTNSDGICVEFCRNDVYFDAPCTAKARYVLDAKKPRFSMELSFVCDKDVPCNLTNHNYINLGETDVSKVALKMPSSQVMTYDREGIPLGYVPVTGHFDFRRGRYLNFPMDHAFHLDEANVKAWTENVVLSAKSNACNVVVFLVPLTEKSLPGKSGFTLEFVHFPMLGEEMILPAKTEHLLRIEYEFASH